MIEFLPIELFLLSMHTILTMKRDPQSLMALWIFWIFRPRPDQGFRVQAVETRFLAAVAALRSGADKANALVYPTHATLQISSDRDKSRITA